MRSTVNEYVCRFSVFVDTSAVVLRKVMMMDDALEIFPSIKYAERVVTLFGFAAAGCWLGDSLPHTLHIYTKGDIPIG